MYVIAKIKTDEQLLSPQSISRVKLSKGLVSGYFSFIPRPLRLLRPQIFYLLKMHGVSLRVLIIFVINRLVAPTYLG